MNHYNAITSVIKINSLLLPPWLAAQLTHTPASIFSSRLLRNNRYFSAQNWAAQNSRLIDSDPSHLARGKSIALTLQSSQFACQFCYYCAGSKRIMRISGRRSITLRQIRLHAAQTMTINDHFKLNHSKAIKVGNRWKRGNQYVKQIYSWFFLPI